MNLRNDSSKHQNTSKNRLIAQDINSDEPTNVDIKQGYTKLSNGESAGPDEIPTEAEKNEQQHATDQHKCQPLRQII
jgi:hypothetical protein